MGRFLVPNQDSKINIQGNITIPTLVSTAGNSQNFVFLPTDNIYFEAEVYLNSYNNVGVILVATKAENGIVNEFAFITSDVTGLDGRGIPQGSFLAYNGVRGTSLSAYYSSTIVNLNVWTKVIAQRINGVWSMSINNIQQAVSRFVDQGVVPNDQFGNANLPVWIGRSGAVNFNIDGQIRNVILSKINKNKISIKKQNLGGGKISLKKN